MDKQEVKKVNSKMTLTTKQIKELKEKSINKQGKTVTK